MMLRTIKKKLGVGWQGFALHPKIQTEALLLFG
jgi:hypothetical protein